MDKDSRSVVYVRYRDHVLFRNADPGLYRTAVRETVGWLEFEDENYIRIVWERPFRRVPFEKSAASGLTILKNEIIELRRLG